MYQAIFLKLVLRFFYSNYLISKCIFISIMVYRYLKSALVPCNSKMENQHSQRLILAHALLELTAYFQCEFGSGVMITVKQRAL